MTTISRIAALAALSVLAAVAAAPAGASSSAPAVCTPTVQHGVLPTWARGGFSDARPKIAHVTGRSGAIMGIFFAQPLEVPPAKDHSNKILWVARVGASSGIDLRIAAQRMVGAHTVGRPVSARRLGRTGPVDHQPPLRRLLAPRASLGRAHRHARRGLRPQQRVGAFLNAFPIWGASHEARS